MSLARLQSRAPDGLDAPPVSVEIHLSGGSALIHHCRASRGRRAGKSRARTQCADQFWF